MLKEMNRIWIFLSILGSVCSDNSNSHPNGKVDERLVGKTKSRTIIGTFVKDQKKSKRMTDDGQQRNEFLDNLDTFKKKFENGIPRNLFLEHEQSRLETIGESMEGKRKVQENEKRTRTSGEYRSGIQVRRYWVNNRKTHSVEKDKEFCKGDSKSDVYTLKIYPRPVEYERHTLKNAQSRKALCLDGTPAAYFFRKSKNSGSRWMVFLPGGAWCQSKETCFARSRTHLGSSKYFPSLVKQAGILSSNRPKNQYFYDWNVLYLQYCDGSSFMGNLENPIVYRKVNLHLRGFRILSTFLDEIVPKYLSKAREVVVVGNSASALGLMANADFISSRIPQDIKVHFVADGGFFIDVPCRDDKHVFTRWMSELYGFHNVTNALLPECVASFKRGEEWKCLMPQHFLRFTKSSIAIINSLADAWQLIYLKGAKCGYVPRSCSSYELDLARQLRKSAQKLLKPVTDMTNLSFFLFSCIEHCTITYDRQWRVLKIGSVVLEDFVYDFIRDGKKVMLIDDSPNLNDDPCPL